MRRVKLGILGLGHIGQRHAEALLSGQVAGASLAAVYTSRPAWIRERAPGVRIHLDTSVFFQDPDLDGVILCSPHRLHVPQALEALRAGKHVLIEKPVASDWREVEALCEARDRAKRVVGVLFQLRADPQYAAVGRVLAEGRLGRLVRVLWVMTAWYREESYYADSPWRGTWQGEGGGVLLNQCAHHLDLLSLWLGMPRQVQAQCAFGKHHAIEVEDEATVLMAYPDGATAVFIASTGEPDGENRLEIVGSEGRLLLEGETLRLRIGGGAWENVPYDAPGAAMPTEVPAHAAMMADFVRAIAGQVPVCVSLEESVCSLQLANAAVESERTGRRVLFPLSPLENK